MMQCAVCTLSDVSQSDVIWWSSYRDACTQSQHVFSSLIMALIGCSIVTETNSKTSENVWFIIIVKNIFVLLTA